MGFNHQLSATYNEVWMITHLMVGGGPLYPLPTTLRRILNVVKYWGVQYSVAEFKVAEDSWMRSETLSRKYRVPGYFHRKQYDPSSVFATKVCACGVCSLT